MIFKDRKASRFTTSGIKFLIAAELVLFVSSYTVYAACNRSQSTRKFFNDSPYLKFVLEYYYKIGDKFGTDTVRQYDELVWYGKEPTKFTIKGRQVEK